MAILDRPMFRRPLTKDQLRRYGLPAFANGGVVDLGYTESGAISDKPIFNPFKGLSLEDYNRMSPQEVLNFYQEVDQTRIPGKIKEAESVDRLYNILRAEGPALPGFMEEIRKPQMTEPVYPGLELQKGAEEMFGDTAKQKQEYDVSQAESNVKKIEDDIKLKEETIKLKESQGLNTDKDKKELEDKKAELESAESTLAATQARPESATGLEISPEARPSIREEEKPEEEKDTTVDTTDTKDTGDDTSTTREEADPVKERSDMEKLKELAKERSALYKELIGDPEKMRRQQGFLQLAQFGLNLASARGGNLAEKIAKSAKDPLQTFAALAREAAQDERAIEIAAIEGAERELALEKELRKKDEKTYQFQATIQTIKENMNVDDQEATRMALGLESDEQKGIAAFSEFLTKSDRSGDILGAAKSSGYILASSLEDPSNYADESGKIKKDVISAEANKVFYDVVDGAIVPYQIKPGAFNKKGEYLDLQEDFVRLPGVKVVSP